MSTATVQRINQNIGLKPGYMLYLLFISGMGGLLAGVDFGIIGSALEFLNKTIQVTEAQLSFIVAIYTGGGILASFFAGILSDWLGRKNMMIIGGLSFVLSILLIYTSQGFVPLLVGRILMGLSGGIICVVVPLYMAECLSARIRGRGTALFQFMLTLGMVTAGAIGVFFTNRNAESVAIAQQLFSSDVVKLNAAIFKANSDAWRYMFLVASIPGAIFSVGAFFIRESPRWLYRKGRTDQAREILRLSLSENEVALEINELAAHNKVVDDVKGKSIKSDSLLQRKYVVPFIIACIVLAATQATGINSVIAYSVIILKQAGLDSISASWGFTTIMALNCSMTLVGAVLVDRVGRKFLLKLGTLGIIAALVSAAFVYRTFESKQINVSGKISSMITENKLELNIMDIDLPHDNAIPMQLSILYSYANKQQMVKAFMPTIEAETALRRADSVFESITIEEKDILDAARKYKNISPQDLTTQDREIVFKARNIINNLDKASQKYITDAENIQAAQMISIAPDASEDSVPLIINRAKWGPIPTRATGWTITALLCLFVSFFAIGPGVCVWLALTELMPTRIRSMGMGIAMVLNNGVQFAIALAFLPVVGQYGFSAMFFFWAGCTVIYFVTAAFFMPETKGKTLEEIEDYFVDRASK
jgi:MFS family permease